MGSRSAVLRLFTALLGFTLTECGSLSSPLRHTGEIVGSDHWGMNMSTPELIAAFGYPVEIHHVVTSDGYILELHRIPHGINETSEASSSGNRPVAYLQHCLLGSSSVYIMNTPNEALAYILADAGYDVWLPNVRGNTYSRNHTSLNPDEEKFWKFSWDEMATIDLPESIDYVLNVTKAEQVYYTGWSMGTTIFFALMSEKPEYNDKIKAMAALAPVAFTGNIEGPLLDLAPFTNDAETILNLLGIGELFPSDPFMEYLAANFCDENSTYPSICYNFLFLLCGPDSEELDKEYLPVIVAHVPAGTSVNTIAHYGQMVNSGNFCKFDYGIVGNLEHYGQKAPPDYDLTKVTASVGLFWGNTDWLGDPTDVAHLAKLLPNVTLNYNVPKKEWNHLDFAWAIHAREYVYDKLLEFFAGH